MPATQNSTCCVFEKCAAALLFVEGRQQSGNFTELTKTNNCCMRILQNKRFVIVFIIYTLAFTLHPKVSRQSFLSMLILRVDGIEFCPKQCLL